MEIISELHTLAI